MSKIVTAVNGVPSLCDNLQERKKSASFLFPTTQTRAEIARIALRLASRGPISPPAPSIVAALQNP
eukprot:scaffold14337_cov132-Isochrysis_galbana.AAC.9